jgi:hypothetical protein
VALSKEQALDATRAILTGPRSDEAVRLDRLHAALNPPTLPGAFTPTVQIPSDAPALMKQLAWKSQVNYLKLLVKTFRQVMKVDGYLSESDEGKAEPWTWWQRNNMDSKQAGIVDSALSYGVSYATALPGTYGRGQAGPAITRYSPQAMTALYQDPESDEWPMLALGVNGNVLSLFDEEMRYTFGIEDIYVPGAAPSAMPSLSLNLGNFGRLTYITQEAHDVGVCPVVRYRDRNLLAGEESMGIVEPLLIVNERITEHTFQAMVADYFQAFKQRYVLGWVPKNEEEELKAGAARIWYLDEDPENVKIDQLEGGSSAPSLSSRAAAIRDFAALGQIPAQAMGIDGISNISDATLAGLEAAKNREASEITTSLGEGHEQLLRLCAFIDGNESAADDYSAEVRWRDFEARSYAATIDGLGKLVTMLGLDPAIALEDVPGMTEQRLVRAQESLRKTQGAGVLETLRQADANANADRTP